MPIHGEFRMLAAQARLARDVGVAEEHIVLAENGSVVELERGRARLVDHVDVGSTFVDGLGVGDVRDVALRDRRHLSEGGVLIVVATVGAENGRRVARPEVIARGFAESDGELIEEARAEAERTLAGCLDENISELKLLQEHVHDAVGQLVYERTRRRPMILPVVVEV
jgi:ribonuclease J